MLMSHCTRRFARWQARTAAGQLVGMPTVCSARAPTAGQYVTLVVGRAWPDGKVEYASAGHLPLLHASRTGVTSRQATGVPRMFCTTDFPCATEAGGGDSLFLHGWIVRGVHAKAMVRPAAR